MTDPPIPVEPPHPEAGVALAWRGQAQALEAQGDRPGAERALRAAIAAAPTDPAHLLALAQFLADAGRIADTAPLLARVLELVPGHGAAVSGYLATGLYDPGLAPEELARVHRGWCSALEAHVAPLPPPDLDSDPNRRLRVAYLSPDFRRHSCADYLEPLLRSHDRATVEVLLYHAWPGRDARTEAFAALADRFIEVADLSDEALAARIRADAVDVLVELAGHSGFNRLPALAWRPAPVQLSWLGYPFTPGLTRLEGRIRDRRADPPGNEAFGSGPVLRLDPCYLCWQPPAGGPDPAAAPGQPFTFGSFNHFAKVNGAVVELWSELLRRVPAARLLMKGKGGADIVLREQLYRAFAARGIAPHRIEMAAFSARADDHLAQYRRVDLALDTFPYNGVTTTLEALWMGVPVVAMAGRHSVARQGVSILGAVGLEALVAASPEAYLALAVGLATDPERLAALRRGLRERLLASPLCDAVGFARRLEGLYRQLWRRACGASTGSTMEAPLEP